MSLAVTSTLALGIAMLPAPVVMEVLPYALEHVHVLVMVLETLLLGLLSGSVVHA
jgi:flagellar biosynthesis protein FliR